LTFGLAIEKDRHAGDQLESNPNVLQNPGLSIVSIGALGSEHFRRHGGGHGSNRCRQFSKISLQRKTDPRSRSPTWDLFDIGRGPDGNRLPLSSFRWGYIIAAPSIHLTPIKAYSLTADFDTLPPAFRTYLLSEIKANVQAIEIADRLPMTVHKNMERWDFLLRLDRQRAPLTYAPDTFLLTTKWDQSPFSNKHLPEIDGQKVLTGCVPVALAQIMKYHQHPQRGSGIVRHTWNGQSLMEILYHPYHWHLMPNVFSSQTAEYQVEALALLIRDLGTAFHTDFGLSVSTTQFRPETLVEYFGYANDIGEMDNSDVDLFFATLQEEIDHMRPLLLRFPGHMTVADGYSSDMVGRRIHVNMGWGGHHDDFYFLEEPVVAGSHTFPADLEIYYNIRPCTGDTCHQDREEGDRIEDGEISGTFGYHQDIDYYPVYLSGDTTITGSRGSIHSFFISIYNSDTERIESNLPPLSLTLPAGLYRLRASIWNEEGSFYQFLPGINEYTVSISTGSIDDEIKGLIDQGLDKPPVIRSEFQDILLEASEFSTQKVLVDARDPNGDAVEVYHLISRSRVFQANVSNGVLTLEPSIGGMDQAVRIFIAATANGKTAGKSFIVGVSDEPIGFGVQFDVAGVFDSQSDIDTYRVILDGDCTVSGYNGYTSQGFFTSVQGTEHTANNQTISGTFQRNIYVLQASLEKTPGGQYYPYTPGEHDQYQLTIHCPNAEPSPEGNAAILGIDPSGIEMVDGDLDGSGDVGLSDAILGLKLLVGFEAGSEPLLWMRDIGSDNKIGLEEVNCILQTLADMR